MRIIFLGEAPLLPHQTTAWKTSLMHPDCRVARPEKPLYLEPRA
jgi:hypothetical protein